MIKLLVSKVAQSADPGMFNRPTLHKMMQSRATITFLNFFLDRIFYPAILKMDVVEMVKLEPGLANY